MNLNLNADGPDSLLNQYETENCQQDREFLALVHRTSSLLHQRAQALGTGLPFAPSDPASTSYQASVVQLVLAFMDFKLSVRGRFPELSHRQMAALTMADTTFARALDFNFLSSPDRSIISRSKDMMNAEDMKIHIGERLAQARQNQGLTQKQVGDMIGMSNASIGRIETGKQKYGMSTLYALLAALNLPIKDAFPPEAFPGPPMTLEQIEELEEAWPRFQREVLGRWKEELRQQKKQRSKTKS